MIAPERFKLPISTIMERDEEGDILASVTNYMFELARPNIGVVSWILSVFILVDFSTSSCSRQSLHRS